MTDNPPEEEGASCPVPAGAGGIVQLAHGGGGRMMNDLIARTIAPAFANPDLDTRHDGAILDFSGGRLAFTTDSYVVNPLFFRGGNIGSLAVNGTANDLAMCAAEPLFLSVSFILEEGLGLEVFERILAEMGACARAAGMRIVTGDTKVVERGKGDGLFVTTSGIGRLAGGPAPGPERVESGDVIVLSGDLGRHGIAIMAERAGLDFEDPVISDCAALWPSVRALLEAGVAPRCLRDLTRGGLASALTEIASAAAARVEIAEDDIAVSPGVRGACELLGLDPLHVANEGRFVAIVPARDAGLAVAALAEVGLAKPAVIGEVGDRGRGEVLRRGRYGVLRRLDMPAGEQLPRIC